MDFYCRAFGFEIAFQERAMREQIRSMTGLPGLTCDIAQLRVPQSSHVLELIAFREEAVRAPAALEVPIRSGAAHVAFFVEDLDAAMTRVEALGAVRLGEVTCFSDGRSVYYREPAGSFFEMEQEFGDRG